MNRYQTPSPRKTFALASIALTAITLGLAIVVPARVGPVHEDVRMLAPIEVVAKSSPVDRVVTPETEVVSVRAANPIRARKQES